MAIRLGNIYELSLVIVGNFSIKRLIITLQFVGFVQLPSRVQLFSVSWTVAHQPSLSFTISWSLLKLMPFESLMLMNHLILCCRLLLLPSIFPNIRVSFSELSLHIRWPKYCSFDFSISHSNEYSGLISFRIDWLNLIVVQGTLELLSSITV